jgi:hypothetical protein
MKTKNDKKTIHVKGHWRFYSRDFEDVHWRIWVEAHRRSTPALLRRVLERMNSGGGVEYTVVAKKRGRVQRARAAKKK